MPELEVKLMDAVQFHASSRQECQAHYLINLSSKISRNARVYDDESLNDATSGFFNVDHRTWKLPTKLRSGVYSPPGRTQKFSRTKTQWRHLATEIVILSLYIFSSQDLTRFNKIAVHGAPQMAVDQEAILAYRESTHTILSVTCPYSMCNLP